jgi:hypothetical protein
MDRGLRKFTAHGAKPPFTDAKERQKAYKAVFSSELGEKVLQDILSASGFFKPYIPSSAKPDNVSQAMFDHGKKYFCYEILNLLTIKLKEAEMTAELNDYNHNPLTIED